MSNNNTNNNTNNNNNSSSSTSQSASASSSTPINIPATAPVGGLVITQPPQTATSYYKIAPSNTITFAWNFTNVLVTPSALTISAVCGNGNTYPVGNGTLAGTATSVEWDLWSYQQANPSTPLAVETYTLEIWTGSKGAAEAPGQLAENSDLQFALYTPQPYTPLSSWTCAGCNVSGAWSSYIAHPAFVSLVATVVIMFLSGYSVLRQARN